MRRESPSDACGGGCVVQLFTRGGGFPASAGGRPVDHAQKRTDQELTAGLDPGFELVPGPAIHSYLAAFTSLASTDEDRAAGSIQIAFLKRERFIDPEPGTPEQDDQGAKALTVGAVTDGSHDRNDLLDGGRISGVLLALVPWWAASVLARHGRW